MKALVWLGSSRDDVRGFPDIPRQRVGHELFQVQRGLNPSDWKPFGTVGAGVVELRVEAEGAFRVLYVAKFSEAVYVLHAFQKKTRRTRQADIDVARKRFRNLERWRKQQRR
ncbi:MAG: type II toxin-antitoxin system RelE/ParE family toxin [Gemmatimonadales bacterium]